MNNQVLQFQQNYNEFISKAQVTNINISDVFLKEIIHKNSTVNFDKEISKAQSKNLTQFDRPIIVKQEDNLQYSLVSGYKKYCIAKALNHEQIPAIIITESRLELKRKTDFINSDFNHVYNSYNIDDIYIPLEFMASHPSKDKIKNCVKYYKKHKKFDKPIVITKAGLCIDGYIRYLIALRLGVKRVPVIIA